MVLGPLGAKRLLELLMASATPMHLAWLSARAHTNQVTGWLATTYGQHKMLVFGSWELAAHQGQHKCKVLNVVLQGTAGAADARVLLRPRYSDKWSAWCQYVLLGALECREQYQCWCGGTGGP